MVSYTDPPDTASCWRAESWILIVCNEAGEKDMTRNPWPSKVMTAVPCSRVITVKLMLRVLQSLFSVVVSWCEVTLRGNVSGLSPLE